MSAPVIRPAQPADLPLIHQLIHELALYEREPQAAQATLEQLQQTLFDEGHVAHALVCEDAGEAVGFAVYFFNYSTWTGRKGIYLEDLFVRQAHRGRGAGKALLQHIARLAVEQDCGRFEWSVLDWNSPAIAFYRACGAKPMDQWTVFRLDGPALAAFAAG